MYCCHLFIMNSILGSSSDTGIQLERTITVITINWYPISSNQWAPDYDQRVLSRNVVLTSISREMRIIRNNTIILIITHLRSVILISFDWNLSRFKFRLDRSVWNVCNETWPCVALCKLGFNFRKYISILRAKIVSWVKFSCVRKVCQIKFSGIRTLNSVL